ncbi:MAG TPA: hypothetical protein VFB84_16770 [Micromonosporaceae bacterium]|nr:hypothetical protein [Micromonosporaceae bacterium]
MLLVGLAPAAPAHAATYTKVVRYGPFTIPAGSDANPGVIHNKLTFAVQRPCIDCYLTSFTPDLVYSDGTRATMETGPMLHHAVLTSQFQRDATCGGSWLGLAGERFFASGDERTAVRLPYGYGYRVRWYDSWNLLVDLMNHANTQKTVYLCAGDPLAVLAQGQTVRLHSMYQSSHAADDVMGIMIGYINPS